MPPFPGFFIGGLTFSGGSMSTTMQVVSSLNPFTLTASCDIKKTNQVEFWSTKKASSQEQLSAIVKTNKHQTKLSLNILLGAT